EGLAMATHGANTHAQAVDRRGGRTESWSASKNFVGLGFGLPFFARHAIAQILVYPRDQAATQWYAKMLAGQVGILLGCEYTAIDPEYCSRGVGQQRACRGIQARERV